MKVKVNKAGLSSYWYADKIGKVYDVEEIQLGNHKFEYKVIGSELGGTKYFDKDDVELISEEKEMQFTKDMLRTGMRVIYNNGQVAIVLKDINVLISKDGFCLLNHLDSDMCYDHQHNQWSVKAVHEGYTANSDVLNFSDLGKLLWKREVQTPEQKQLQEVMTKISELQSQAEKLQELINK